MEDVPSVTSLRDGGMPPVVKQTSDDGSHHIHVNQHCELTLAVHFLRAQSHIDGPIKIGCSETSCHWCLIYIQSLNDHLLRRRWNRKIITSTMTSDKVNSDWLMPEGFGPVRNMVFQKIGQLVETMLSRGPELKTEDDVGEEDEVDLLPVS